MWQWYNWLRGEIASTGKRVVTLNLDETPIPTVYLGLIGNVVPRVGSHLWTTRCYFHCTSFVRRQHFTLVMIICDDDVIQRLLPQLLIVGDKLLTYAEFLMLHGGSAPQHLLKKAMRP